MRHLDVNSSSISQRSTEILATMCKSASSRPSQSAASSRAFERSTVRSAIKVNTGSYRLATRLDGLIVVIRDIRNEGKLHRVITARELHSAYMRVPAIPSI
ncbi:hypothetical protein HBH56_181530 [Parastagonospora nodorum]|uniref:Uncharacterized protein n=1 Tax=Phaeosphaeria nodorum (strain SN15 / ATCC MYA-4574 / FGSC 10173) TaxID=321614 RepID=A0A7U2I5M0_PHANO|nr:hypothetical protein HBH56_181530 [Parastagonospora nodorum]QRD04266.1 hypothetical protein JI435_420890 [Parastagonospora nodorum SN15]KAH3926103.1 hypothetical protein HBH54_170680 [Parastagonospora nodorum]KAH3964955.1 hypothetical protein HBH51_153180 [Parastagonospora nodorum]KAH3995272.1 hypothetical protein HBI10_171230 [Parastagonospora nodorum]